MRQLILNTFPCQTGNCIEIRTETIFWVDEYPADTSTTTGKSFVITQTNDDLLFTVKNEQAKEISFLAIDKGIFLDTTNFPFQKCDFALFDDVRFCFIECKDSVAKQRSKERNSAFEQLKETILIFKKSIDFGNYEIEAQVSLKARRVFPRQRCSREDKVKEFEDELNVALYENNEITF